MSENISDQNTNGQSQIAQVKKIQLFPKKKSKFLSKKTVKLQQQIHIGFQSSLKNKGNKGKTIKSFKSQDSQISSANEMNKQNPVVQQKQQSFRMPFDLENVRLKRLKKRKNHEIGTTIVDKNKPYLEAYYLKDLVKKNKIHSIVKNFINKIKRVSTKGEPIEYNIKQQLQIDNSQQLQAIQISPLTQIILTIINIVHILAINIFVSLGLVFSQCRSGTFVTVFSIINFLFLFFDLFLNLGTVKVISGKKIKKVKEIWNIYPSTSFTIDIMTIFIFFIQIFYHGSWLTYISLIVVCKIPSCLQKIQKVQNYFISNLYNQQYWSLIKIVMSNFAFAHIISILLAAMPLLNVGQNWMMKRDIINAAWHERYIWSYYWGNTIMLTVGFGDIVVSSSTQALCLIFIETFSCLIFAYNINCIGTIMHNIRQNDAEKDKKRKIIKKLAQQNDLPEELTWKINNYIIQNAQIKKLFNFQQQRQFVVSLPDQIKKQYHKQSNKKVFEKITFFKSFVSKTLYNLAETIEIKISHPQQIIQSVTDNYNLIIMKIGQIAFTCKKFNTEIKDLSMDKLSIKQPNNQSILNLDFILRKRQPYEIKSLQYTIYYYLGYDKFIDTIRQSSYDYEYLCSLRDKIKNIPDQFQVLKCNICNGHHLKLNCPKLHFIPYHETVIGRELHQQKICKNDRKKITRNFVEDISPFANFKRSMRTQTQLTSFGSQKRRIRSKSSRKLLYKDKNMTLLSCTIEDNTQQAQTQRQLQKIIQKYNNMNNQIIKQELNKILKQQESLDEVWIIKLDQIKDYNNYFPAFNPCNIQQKHQKKKNKVFNKNELIKLHNQVNLNQITGQFQEQQRKMSLIINNLVNKQKRLTA